jgi:hypothetical protein
VKIVTENSTDRIYGEPFYSHHTAQIYNASDTLVDENKNLKATEPWRQITILQAQFDWTCSFAVLEMLIRAH